MENIDLSALLGEAGATHSERIGALVIEDDTLTARLWDIGLTFTNASRSLRVEIEFEFEARLGCVRCLTPFWRKGSVTGSEEFELFRGGAASGEGAPREDRSIFVGGCFDIGELARQRVLTELPLVPYCRDDCAGLCPECGANLNDGACGCGRDGGGESPLAAAFREAEAKKRKGDGSAERQGD